MGVAEALDFCVLSSGGPEVLGVENQVGLEAQVLGSLSSQKRENWGFV